VSTRLESALPSRHRGRPVPLVVFAAAMGWLEAVVVVYIRALLGIRREEGIPAAAEVMRRLETLPWFLATEQGRELATLVMLGAVAWLAADRLRARIGAFLLCFGVWDLAYYAGLVALLRWPPSLASMDLLFLIPPHPAWYQPVWVPVGISCGMIGVGVWLIGSRADPRA
jgi:hypothetical protein